MPAQTAMRAPTVRRRPMRSQCGLTAMARGPAARPARWRGRPEAQAASTRRVESAVGPWWRRAFSSVVHAVRARLAVTSVSGGGSCGSGHAAWRLMGVQRAGHRRSARGWRTRRRRSRHSSSGARQASRGSKLKQRTAVKQRHAGQAAGRPNRIGPRHARRRAARVWPSAAVRAATRAAPVRHGVTSAPGPGARRGSHSSGAQAIAPARRSTTRATPPCRGGAANR